MMKYIKVLALFVISILLIACNGTEGINQEDEEYSDLFIGSFEIFPISESIYTIHSLGFPVERHIQFIKLP